MLTAFDHLIIAVRDLDGASRAYRRLGFDVRPGGRNPGNGTYNAIVRFGVDYMELLSIEDAAVARQHAPRGSELQSYLEARVGGSIGFVVQSDDIAADADRARRAGFIDIGEPVPMERVRPDGSAFAWRLLIPGASAFRQAWPLLIQWTTSDADRLAIEPPGNHENGVLGLDEVVLAVRSLPAAITLYRDQLGLLVDSADQSRMPGAFQARTRTGPVAIRLLAPDGGGPVADEISDHGEGVFSVQLGVRDLDATRRLLTGRGVNFADLPGSAIDIDPADTVGVRIMLAERNETEGR